MTTRQKIAHLLRRFGLGATQAELDRLEPFGEEGALNWLLNWEKSDDGVPVLPWEFCHEDGQKEIYVDPFRFAAYWSASLLLSQRPLQQKLSIFWHDHFAVSGTKVEFGPSMLDYLRTLQNKGGGKFGELLLAVSTEPAMIKYLDTDASLRGRPNENFAREVLELFTFGEGNGYTEKDIQEASRAFTGWGVRLLVIEAGGDKIQESIRNSILTNTPMTAFALSPSLHDDSDKTILGKTAPFTGEAVLEMLANHPTTVKTITAKLWRHFACDKLPEATHASLIKRWNSTGGDIREVLREIAKQETFWSPECVRQVVKSPADFVVPIVRQLNVRDYVIQSRPADAGPMKRAAKPFMDTAGLIFGMMAKQGMTLLFPPNVSGWEWGHAWITPSNMLERTAFGNLIMGVGQADQGLAAYLALQILGTNPADDAACVDRFLTQFDAEFAPDKRKLLVDAFVSNGGKPSLATPQGASKSLAAVARLVFGSPEFQMC